MWGDRGEPDPLPSSDHLYLLPAATDNDDDATGTFAVNPSSPYARAPANNPTPG